MTTSNSYNFGYNRNQIIKASLRKIGAFAAGETPDAQSINDAADALNAMVKRWSAKGIHVWTESEATLFLQPSQIQYSIYSSSTDHPVSSYTATTVATAAVAGAGTVVVTSATGISTGYAIGIVLDDGTIQWTTVNGAPAGTTITLTAVLTDSVAAGNNVYVHATTNVINRPLRVPMARRYNISSALDTPMKALSRQDYRDLPNKTHTGTPTQFFYDPQISIGYMFIWPAPIDASNAVKFTWYRPIQDFDTAGDDPDLPQEWIDTLIYNLAVILAPEYDCPMERYTILKTTAAEFLDDVMSWDKEPESTYFGVDFQGYGA